jgi:hypothetical protein
MFGIPRNRPEHIAMKGVTAYIERCLKRSQYHVTARKPFQDQVGEKNGNGAIGSVLLEGVFSETYAVSRLPLLDAGKTMINTWVICRRRTKSRWGKILPISLGREIADSKRGCLSFLIRHRPVMANDSVKTRSPALIPANIVLEGLDSIFSARQLSDFTDYVVGKALFACIVLGAQWIKRLDDFCLPRRFFLNSRESFRDFRPGTSRMMGMFGVYSEMWTLNKPILARYFLVIDPSYFRFEFEPAGFVGTEKPESVTGRALSEIQRLGFGNFDDPTGFDAVSDWDAHLFSLVGRSFLVVLARGPGNRSGRCPGLGQADDRLAPSRGTRPPELPCGLRDPLRRR